MIDESSLISLRQGHRLSRILFERSLHFRESKNGGTYRKSERIKVERNVSEGRRCDFSTTSGLRNRRRHAHARTHAYTHNRVGLHTVTAGKEQQEKRHISPLHSPLGRVVGVLVGYSPEFTVKRKQWPRQNRSWHECTKNRRRNGTRSIDRHPDRRRSVAAPIFQFSDSSRRPCDLWLIERTKFNENTKDF